jgi:metallo-beta-lactamase class B
MPMPDQKSSDTGVKFMRWVCTAVGSWGLEYNEHPCAPTPEAGMSGKIIRVMLIVYITAVLASSVNLGWAQTPSAPAPDHPQVVVHGRTFTPRSILARNMGTEEDQTAQFPPHKIIGNLYYVGTRTLGSFLLVTPQGNILINSTYERNVLTIKKSVEQLGFRFSDIKILLGTHAHADHQEGDALVKQLTGAQTMAMAEDVPALQAITPDGKEHPIDKILHDGETVTLGGTTLTAHLTAGHTRGCTTWTLKEQEEGKTYNVVIGCSLRPPNTLTPDIVAEFNRTFPLVRSLACDVPLGDHPAQYNMLEKYAKLQKGAPNPFIDPDGCTYELDIEEAMFDALLNEQGTAPRP